MAATRNGGAYLRRRREAARLSIDDVAFMIATNDVWTAFNKQLIALIESDDHVPTPRFLVRMRGAFAFDPYVYRQLVGGMQVRACRTCACSDLDPCDDEETGPCGWSAHDPALCTHCAGAAAIGATHLHAHAA